MPKRSNPFDSLPVEGNGGTAQSPAGNEINQMKQFVETAIDALKKERSGLGIYAFPISISTEANKESDRFTKAC